MIADSIERRLQRRLEAIERAYRHTGTVAMSHGYILPLPNGKIGACMSAVLFLEAQRVEVDRARRFGRQIPQLPNRPACWMQWITNYYARETHATVTWPLTTEWRYRNFQFAHGMEDGFDGIDPMENYEIAFGVQLDEYLQGYQLGARGRKKLNPVMAPDPEAKLGARPRLSSF